MSTNIILENYIKTTIIKYPKFMYNVDLLIQYLIDMNIIQDTDDKVNLVKFIYNRIIKNINASNEKNMTVSL